MTTCREFAAWIDAFVDGELPVDRAVDAECHASECPGCAERVRFQRAFRASIQHAVQSQVGSTSVLQQRIASALIAERVSRQVHACTPTNGYSQVSFPRREPISRNAGWSSVVHSDSQASRAIAAANSWGAMRWRTLLPLAAVAAGAILFAGLQRQTPIAANWNRAGSTDLKLSELDSYLDQMVSRHLAKKQPQPIRFPQDEPLDPPFRLPLFQDIRNTSDPYLTPSPGLTALRGTSSAYQVRGHRVTFFAYEAAAAPLRARLEGHSLRGHVVYVGQRQGYSVATVEEGPVGYAMTSDLPPLESADLIASAVEARVQH
jgi:hypothetical protein